jgi:hypothetical protein
MEALDGLQEVLPRRPWRKLLQLGKARMEQDAAIAEQGSLEGAGDVMSTKWGQLEELWIALVHHEQIL